MKSAFRNNQNGTRGVHCTAGGRWIASGSFGGKKKYIGSFGSMKEAQQAYQKAVEEYQHAETKVLSSQKSSGSI